jgi:hypothetical protein
VTAGVELDDLVVEKGSFSLRAERERLGLRPATSGGQAGVVASTPDRPSATDLQTARIIVSDEGYQPDRVTVHAGVPARLTFVRTSDKTCGAEVTIPSLDIKRALPLNEPVGIDFTPKTAGDVAFVCGMGMLRGTIVVQ